MRLFGITRQQFAPLDRANSITINRWCNSSVHAIFSAGHIRSHLLAQTGVESKYWGSKVHYGGTFGKVSALSVTKGEKFDGAAQNEIWLPFLDDYRTFVSLEPKRVLALLDLLAE